ncbi:MAG: asparaginase [Bdellovibrionales bacterium]|nr:asparaginase [Bdellovibrionales bacterium]
MKKIWIFTTGGTIEKSYSEDEGSLANRESVLKQKLLEKLRLPYTQVCINTILAKDSLDMNDEDRQLIFQRIQQALNEADGIVVLHGTDTLDVTMRFCESRLPQPTKAIIFTGAMKPAGFDDSDAIQNFTEALYAAQVADPGYYLSFHGQLFKGTHIQKNKQLRTFEYKK